MGKEEKIAIFGEEMQKIEVSAPVNVYYQQIALDSVGDSIRKKLYEIANRVADDIIKQYKVENIFFKDEDDKVVITMIMEKIVKKN